MTESLEREIRDLRSLFWSERDPDGRGFAPLADAYRRAGDFRQAIELLSDGLDRLPRFATGHVVSARVHLEAGLLEEAELAARKALELDADNVWALRTLGDALAGMGDEARAAEARARLHALDPLDPVDAPPGPEATAEAEKAPPERVLDIGALAPEEREAAPEPVVDIGTLAPEEREAAPEPVVDIGTLAPGEREAASEPVVDIGTLAPGEPEVAPEPVVDIGRLAPDEPLEEPGWDAGQEAPGEPIHTRTIAELYVRQGLTERAIDVYRHLVGARPDDAELRARLVELEAALDSEEAPAGEEAEEEAEVHARYLASAGERGASVETPFAWTEEDASGEEAQSDAPPISRYFERMLSWAPPEEER